MSTTLNPATTYLSRSCGPGSDLTSLACQTSGSTTAYDSSVYDILAVYQAASTYFDGEGEYSLSLYWQTIPLLTYNQWQSSIETISWDRAPYLIQLELEVAHITPDPIQAMPTEVQSYIVSAYLPQYKTGMEYYEVAVETTTPELTASVTPSETSVPAAGLVPATTAVSVLSASSPEFRPPPSSKSSSWTTRRLVAVSLPVSLALILAICVFLFLHKRRQRERGGHITPSRDYNAEPLFPHRPLANLSDTSFTTHREPWSESMVPHAPKVPELASYEQESRVILSSTPSSSNGTPELSASQFGDPFSARVSLVHSAQTPGVSPSSYPLRDRLNHDATRRQRAINSLARKRSFSGKPLSRKPLSRRTSVSEQELKHMIAAFDASDTDTAQPNRSRKSKSLDDISKHVADGSRVAKPDLRSNT